MEVLVLEEVTEAEQVVQEIHLLQHLLKVNLVELLHLIPIQLVAVVEQLKLDKMHNLQCHKALVVMVEMVVDYQMLLELQVKIVVLFIISLAVVAEAVCLLEVAEQVEQVVAEMVVLIQVQVQLELQIPVVAVVEMVEQVETVEQVVQEL